MMSTDPESSPFLVHLNLESPRPRFILEHKYVQSFHDLTENDMKELVNLAVWLVNEINTKKAFLSISIGENKDGQRAYENFYAQLVISNMNQLSPTFKALVVDKWVVARRLSSVSMSSSDSDTLSASSSCDAAMPDSPLVEQNLRFLFDNVEETTKEFSEPLYFTTSFCMEKRIVGVCSSNFTTLLKQPAERWQLLQFMSHRLTPREQPDQTVSCSLIISLTSFFTIQQKKVFGLVKFRKIPVTSNLSTCGTEKDYLDKMLTKPKRKLKTEKQKKKDITNMNICEKEIEYDSKVWVMIDVIGISQT